MHISMCVGVYLYIISVLPSSLVVSSVSLRFCSLSVYTCIHVYIYVCRCISMYINLYYFRPSILIRRVFCFSQVLVIYICLSVYIFTMYL